MGAEVKYLGDGSAVLVVGEGPTESTSLDGGRTLTEVPTVTIARLTTENVHPEQLYSEVPEVDEETGAVVTQADAASSTGIDQGTGGSGGASLGEPVAAPGGFDRTAGTPSGASDREVIPARGESQNADQLDAEIARLTALRDAQAKGGADTSTNAPSGAPEPGAPTA